MHSLRLSIALSRADFKLRNEGSYLGILWYLLNPFLAFLILFFVFSKILGPAIEVYPLYLLLGMIMFNVFRQVTVEATRVIYNNRLMIKSINFPREALIGSIVIRSLYVHSLEIFIFLFFALFFHISLLGFLLYPFIVIIFAVFLYGLALLLSILSVYFMDLENIWGAFTQALWFITPIFYSIETNAWLLFLNLFNPLYYFISIARSIVIYSEMPPLWMLGMIVGYALLTVFLGKLIFKKFKVRFAEVF